VKYLVAIIGSAGKVRNKVNVEVSLGIDCPIVNEMKNI